MSHAGFVLVGGASSRMGRNKALLPYKDTVLASWVARQVELAAGPVTLIGTPEHYRALQLPVLADLRSGCGPLAGIETALDHTRAEWNLIVACDMPAIDAPFLTALLAQAAHEETDCLLPINAAGRPEPLCAVWHRRSLAAVRDALDRGVRKITCALDSLRVVRSHVSSGKWIENLNTPVEWQSHLAAISDD